MAIVKPFCGLRPIKEMAEKVASPPYDVISSQEAAEMASDNPFSFLHVVKSEIDLPPETDPYDPRVYQKAAENLNKLQQEGILVRDAVPCFYLYQQIMGGHKQIGLVACTSVEEYQQDIIKKHELTREVKELDRTNHVSHLNANSGPVFLTYKQQSKIDSLVTDFIDKNSPEYDFTSQGIRHTFWKVDKSDIIAELEGLFVKQTCLYVADGHHRSAAATRVAKLRQEENSGHDGNEEYNFFLSVLFPDNQMLIMAYNRVVKDLGDYNATQFLEQLNQNFQVEPQDEAFEPPVRHQFGLYLEGKWYSLQANEGTFSDQHPVESLDCSILQKNLLEPVLSIGDPRKDERINFIGGIRGLKELERLVDSGNYQVAFSLHPTSVEQLMTLADAGEIMPPKSTWFEPKLKSGLVVHALD